MNKLLSVIVLSYKNIDGVFKTLESVLQQDYGNIEIIVSDDGTPDFSEYIDKIENYVNENKKKNISNFLINAIKVNGGTVKNINSAINLSKGDYIKLISAEDIFSKKEALSTFVSFLEDSDYKIAFCKMRGVTPEGEYKYNLLSCESDYDLLKSYSVEQTLKRLYRRCFLPAPGAIFKKELFEENGLFKEDTRLIEDYPYWMHLAMNGVAFGYIDEVLIDYKLSGVSSAGSYSEMFMQDMLIIYDKYIFPYDKRFGVLQPFYNMLKRGGLNFYIAEAKRSKMSTGEKIVARIKYLPFYVFVKVQNFLNGLKK